MTYYIGNEIKQEDILGVGNPRFFYAIRRDDDGNLFFSKLDQITDLDTAIIINDPGMSDDNFENFEYGVDFFDGRAAEDHSRPYPNLHWDQYRWDNKNMFYYINSNGEFIVRVNKQYTYPEDSIVG